MIDLFLDLLNRHIEELGELVLYVAVGLAFIISIRPIDDTPDE